MKSLAGQDQCYIYQGEPKMAQKCIKIVHHVISNLLHMQYANDLT